MVFLAHPTKKGSKAMVLFMVEGKDKATVIRFVEEFRAKRGKPDEVKNTTCDLAHGYRNAM